MTAIVTLTDAGGGKTLYRAVALHKDMADHDPHEKMGFQDGWGTRRPARRARAEPRGKRLGGGTRPGHSRQKVRRNLAIPTHP